ncbi:SAM-dependent methyltransferase HcgC family protein [uncultured Methanobrevibacter sp.]|uniref:SAM-dependent methyltransferase HcgC family protein n=1 Tax=uncultured Methanobrevibacter sp. TaxID=253161 RepID=UPI0025FFE467|nr:SAM-dependent methyltransferase HcgC family protein [uncultured Methanobrevibacter sp.]
MNSQDYDTGISSEVFTVKSRIKLLDIFNLILERKATAVLDLFNGLIGDGIIEKESSIIIIGSYFTGTAIAKYLAINHFNDITIVDIYPHLEGLIDSKIGNPIELQEFDESGDFKFNEEKKFKNIKFSSDLSLIKNVDIVIDTTGLGGINESQSQSINSNVFLIEDPIAEDNDSLLKNKNNIYHRVDLVNSNRKYVLKTKGLNTKTSGTMTFTIDVLRQSMNRILATEGVLYCSSEMTFFEEIIFKQKDLDKFFSLIESSAIKVSTILPFDCDDVIRDFIDEIYSEILIR